jgi:hypothetical protein
MRNHLLARSCALGFLLFAGTASAEDARAVLDRAIQAHGGAARLERTKKGHLKGKCEGIQSNAPFEYETEEWFDLPARNKRIAEGKSNGVPFQVEWLFIGKEGWKRELPRPAHYFTEREPLSSVEGQWYPVLAVLLLLREKDVWLTSLPDETKDGCVLVGIHAANPRRSGDYFFDKSTGLLKRSKVIERAQESVETTYDDYREIQGIHYPMRFKVAGETYSSTFTLSSIEFLDKIDESVFAKPPTPEGERTTTESSEKTPEQRNRVLIAVTLVAGAIVGAVWFIVRASKRGSRETPPS